MIVDQSAESREVLRTVLSRRGVDIYEASGGKAGLQIARQKHPDLIVLDLEAVSGDDPALRVGFGDESRRQQTPMVVLGNLRQGSLDIPARQVIPKPYHYGPLIRRIEELLAENSAADRRV